MMGIAHLSKEKYVDLKLILTIYIQTTINYEHNNSESERLIKI